MPDERHPFPPHHACPVISAAQGLEKTVIAARPDVAVAVVSRRRKRFAEAAMTGLADWARGPTRRTSYHPVMKTSGITAGLPAQDLGRAKAFYVEKVGLQALESGFLQARDGQVGLTVGDGVSQLFVYPARARSSGEFTQAVIHVTDVRAAVEEIRGRGVVFEEYDTPETRTENGVARMPGGGEAAWFKDSECNLVGVVSA
jgi:predicted enzyme related to lactoylglutathione lyase